MVTISYVTHRGRATKNREVFLNSVLVITAVSMAILSLTAKAFVPVTLGVRQRAAFVRRMASVTGSIYTADDDTKVIVTLYTKEGCTLCDKVKDVLYQIKDEPGFSHSLRQIDITDADQKDSFDRYKYDIPVLHVGLNEDDNDDVYWTKHRLTADEAKDALSEARSGSFAERQGRPNAAAMER